MEKKKKKKALGELTNERKGEERENSSPLFFLSVHDRTALRNWSFLILISSSSQREK